jgi:hypothetical protein
MCAGEPCVVASSRIDRLTYVRNEGFRTPDLALPFKVLADLKSPKSKLARHKR